MESIKNKQELMKVLGEFGCYFLSILYLAEQINGKEIDPVRAFVECSKEKITAEDATVMDAGKLLSYFTGISFSARKENAEYATKKNEYEVLVFNNTKYTHFVAGDGKNNVACDPLGHSHTVATGKIIGKRIFCRV